MGTASPKEPFLLSLDISIQGPLSLAIISPAATCWADFKDQEVPPTSLAGTGGRKEIIPITRIQAQPGILGTVRASNLEIDWVFFFLFHFRIVLGIFRVWVKLGVGCFDPGQMDANLI